MSRDVGLAGLIAAGVVVALYLATQTPPLPTPPPPDVSPLPPVTFPKTLAEAIAASHAKPVLAIAGGESCPYCKRLKQTLADPTVQSHLKAYLVYEFDAGKETAAWVSGGIPAYAVYKDGTVTKTGRGYKRSSAFIGWLDGAGDSAE